MDLGQAKNRNKNPVAERAFQEIENELLRHDPQGGPVSLSSHSQPQRAHPLTWPFLKRDVGKRDQFLNHQMPLHDQSIIIKQNEQRIANHTHSEAKTPITRRR